VSQCWRKRAGHCTGGADVMQETLIEAGLAPLAPERQLLAASRVFLSELDARIEAREDFAIKTTLAGRSYLLFVDRLGREHQHMIDEARQ